MNKKQQIKVYVDGSNTFYAQKKLGWLIDWKKVKRYFTEFYNVIEIRYYVGLKEGDDSMKGFLRYLDKVGIEATTKPLKKILLEENDVLFKHSKDGYVYKANFDVEITADILLEAESINRVIIFSGDSDFAYLIYRLRSLGKEVMLFSSRKTIAWELKLEKVELVFIEDIADKIKKTYKNP